MRLDVDVELAPEPFARGGHVRLAAAQQLQLVGELGARDAQRRVFVDQAPERLRELRFVEPLRWRDRDREERFRELHRGQQHLRVGRAQRVAGADAVEPCERDDRAGAGRRDGLLFLAEQARDPRQAHCRVGARCVHQRRRARQRAGEDAHHGELALLRVHDGLTDLRDDGAIRARHDGLAVRVQARLGGRRREEAR
ncbi:MAG TPA: hypothetical protein VIW69_15680, partial [Candidatus Elarobacter sp.]